MLGTLVVVLDGVSQLEYARATPLAPAQRDYLDRLDQNMDAGIELGAQHIDQPNALQRAQFIAMQLLQAVQDGNESVAAATCARSRATCGEISRCGSVLATGTFASAQRTGASGVAPAPSFACTWPDPGCEEQDPSHQVPMGASPP